MFVALRSKHKTCFCYNTVCFKPAELENTFDFAEYFPIEQQVFKKFSLSRQISGFRRGVVTTFALLITHDPSNMRPLGCPETSITNYQHIPCNTPERQRLPLKTILHKAGVQKFSKNLGDTPNSRCRKADNKQAKYILRSTVQK
jgi:hypothetical protein